ncbi:hypothetical protein RhiirA4_425880 [Rhizophagus irregularis]|uniref:Uncharacterized protein n=1 Tax=Rhizophagus irregularis TaxID=588596 RepID=A0A2I1H2Y7_9GLOM|nr:hypothetical protein RhiirA4_425880 [Rhizophagus irregularis]
MVGQLLCSSPQFWSNNTEAWHRQGWQKSYCGQQRTIFWCKTCAYLEWIIFSQFKENINKRDAGLRWILDEETVIWVPLKDLNNFNNISRGFIYQMGERNGEEEEEKIMLYSKNSKNAKKQLQKV